MDTAQLFFRARNSKNDEEVLDKVQSYLAALLHNGQVIGDHSPMAKVRGGYLVTASVPETDAPADRFANNVGPQASSRTGGCRSRPAEGDASRHGP